MPVLWQSSQRPMYVRTVWVDGLRHAILTKDDPYLLKLAKRRRPYSSASTKTRLSQDEEYPRRLNLVVKSGKSVITRRPKSSQTVVEQLHLTDIEQDSDEELLKVSPQPLNESGRQDLFSMKNFRANKTARTDVNDTELSDRVLQWLDLAGKVDLLAPGKERMAQPRHSWPEIQRRHNLIKSKTAIDIRAKEKVIKCDTPKAQNGYIDRHDFYVPTSANTIENYARQTRNKTVGDTQKTVNNKIKPPNKVSVAETRQKVASERHAVEKQYADLINKKMIPDVNKNTKKQVHIFIPEMPKKPGSNVSGATSGIDSLLPRQALKLIRH